MSTAISEDAEGAYKQRILMLEQQLWSTHFWVRALTQRFLPTFQQTAADHLCPTALIRVHDGIPFSSGFIDFVRSCLHHVHILLRVRALSYALSVCFNNSQTNCIALRQVKRRLRNWLLHIKYCATIKETTYLCWPPPPPRRKCLEKCKQSPPALSKHPRGSECPSPAVM